MIISHKHKFIFVKTYKTAGTSLEVLLSQNLGAKDISTPFGVEHMDHVVQNHTGTWLPFRELANGNWKDRRNCVDQLLKKKKFYNHIPARIARDRLPKKIWNSYFKFCVERNPWDKVVSLYNMRKSEASFDMSLPEFIRTSHCRNFEQYCDLSGNIIVDHVIKYETLNTELAETLAKLGVPFSGELTVKAKSHFRTDKRSYRELLTEMDKELVANSHSDEILAHNYSF